jgi:hypothetical protein
VAFSLQTRDFIERAEKSVEVPKARWQGCR